MYINRLQVSLIRLKLDYRKHKSSLKVLMTWDYMYMQYVVEK